MYSINLSKTKRNQFIEIVGAWSAIRIETFELAYIISFANVKFTALLGTSFTWQSRIVIKREDNIFHKEFFSSLSQLILGGNHNIIE